MDLPSELSVTWGGGGALLLLFRSLSHKLLFCLLVFLVPAKWIKNWLLTIKCSLSKVFLLGCQVPLSTEQQAEAVGYEGKKLCNSEGQKLFFHQGKRDHR